MEGQTVGTVVLLRQCPTPLAGDIFEGIVVVVVVIIIVAVVELPQTPEDDLRSARATHGSPMS